MLVCHCAVVNDARVREAIASGAQTIAEVTALCDAGGGCGGCRPMICRLLNDRHAGDCGANDCAFRALMSGPPTQLASTA